jgi:hypothetical protein
MGIRRRIGFALHFKEHTLYLGALSEQLNNGMNIQGKYHSNRIYLLFFDLKVKMRYFKSLVGNLLF